MTTPVVEIALFTKDVEGARRFYERILGAPAQAEWPGGAIYASGDATLLIHEHAPQTEEGWPPNEDHIALAVSNLDGTYEQLRSAGLEILVPPRDFPWGRSAYLRDPDGRLVELAQS